MDELSKVDSLKAFIPIETLKMLEQYESDIPHDLAFEEHMTILFSDMRGFTELAEKFDPHDVYASINASLSIQTGIVNKYGGSINKFLGDGLLACFSGEKRGEHALQCLLEMLEVLPVREGEGGLLPCKIGFSLHDGKVLLGLVGDKSRRELTVIGDVVNTAARLCGIAQPFQGLVTEESMNIMPKELTKKHCRFLNSVHFKGKGEPMNIFYLELE
ncbi:MAG: adenylate/guanylate cyclase domain-containing protein [Mariprofundaceae bacterium]